MSAAEQLDPTLTAEATDAAFAAFLAERPQIELDTGRRAPGACACPGRYRIGDKPILTRHDTGCDSVGGDPDAYTYWVSENDGHRIMRRTTLEALSGWIPIPTAPPEQVQAINEVAIRRMVNELHFHLVKLRTGTKQPMGAGWNDPAQTPALTAEQAIAHVADGGGLGVLLGPSRLVVVDCENAAATDLMMSLGFVPVIGTAKGMSPVCADPRADKRGGTHFWFVLPKGVDGSRLENIMQRTVGDAGGVVDVLAGPGRQAVVPPTALIEAGGWAYQLNGNSNVWDWAQAPVLPEVPDWLSDTAAACPAGFENLHGGIAPKQVQARGPQSEASVELSSEIDAIPWSTITALDARMQDWGAIDPECGCSEGHWDGADHARSYWLHDCGRGSYIHIVSGTMLAKLGIGGDEATLSKAQLACILRGVETTGAGFRSTAEYFGIELASGLPSFADTLDEHAEVFEDRADDAGTVLARTVVTHNGVVYLTQVPSVREYWLREAEQNRHLAQLLRAPQRVTAETAGEVFGLGAVVGAVDVAIPDPMPQTDQGTVPSTDQNVDQAADNVVPLRVIPGGADEQDPADGSNDGDGDAGDEAGDAPPAKRVLDVVVREYQGVSPVEGQLMRYPMPEIPAHVPTVEGARTAWRAVLPPIANRHTEKHVQHEWIFTATPGLSQVAGAADARAVSRWGMLATLLPRVAAKIPAAVRLIPADGEVPEVTGPTSQGTSINVYCAAVSPPSSGKTVAINAGEGLIPGVRTLPPGTGEGLLKEFPPAPDEAPEDDDSSGAPAVGTITADLESALIETDEIDTFVGEMFRQGSKTTGWYRSMWMGGQVGNGASDKDRRSLVAAHAYRFGILLGAQPDALAAMFAETSRGTPQRFVWLPAQKSVKRGSYPERLQVAEVHWFGSGPSMIPQMSGQRPPVWIHPPEAAAEALLRDTIAAATANPTEAPSTADPAAAIADNHATLNQLKISVLLAALDGLTAPQDVHWFAAGAVMEVRRAMIYDLVAESKKVRKELARVKGDEVGVTQAAALAARDAEREYHVQRCASTIIRALVKDVEECKGPRTHAQAIKALDGHKRRGGFSDQQLFGKDALEKVMTDSRVLSTATTVKFIGGKAA